MTAPKLTHAQREHLARLAHAPAEVRVERRTGWHEGVLERLAALDFVRLEYRGIEFRCPRSGIITHQADGRWARITDAGRAVVAGAS